MNSMQPPFHKKQIEFILNSTRRWNLAHGAVRTGKTVCTVFRFMQAADACPDSKVFIVGHTFDTAYRNVIRLLLEDPALSIYRPFITWSGKKLYFKDKVIHVLGAKDEGAIGNFQGDTYSVVYCDEMTLYPQSIIEMINSRLSRDYSMGFAAMNPKHPTHILKQWIDKAEQGDNNYYALHFGIDDTPYISDDYKRSLRDCDSSLFYKRNYLGLWCLAEGAIFDFFDRNIHVVNQPPRAADYWICGLDFGTSNAFACVLVGVSTGQYTQTGKCMWVEKEYYYDFKKTNKQKTVSEFALAVKEFIEPYAVRAVYIDPSALPMKLDLQRLGIHCVPANNEVLDGIQIMTSEMAKGNLFVCKDCPNTIREIENYVWDTNKSDKGEDAPVKKGDHSVDALRYVMATHKVQTYNPYKENQNPDQYKGNRFDPGGRRFT